MKRDHKKVVTFRVDPEIVQKLNEFAEKHEMTMSQLVRYVVELFFKKAKRK